MPQLQPNPIRAAGGADLINQRYREGYYTAEERNILLRKTAEANLTDIVNDQGVFKATLTQTIKHVQENWDSLKEIAQQKPPDDLTAAGAWQDTKSGVLAAWNMIQLVAAPFNAIGEVSGNVAEQMSLSAGASPGLAYAIGLAVSIAMPIGPTGAQAAAIRQTVKGVGIAGRAAQAADVAKAAKAAEVAKAAKAAIEPIVEIVKTGLKLDGVTGLEKSIKAGVAEFEKVGPVVSRELPKILSKDDFVKSLRTFRNEMEKVTATKAHSVTLKEAEKLGLGIDDLKQVPIFSKMNESEMAAYLKALDEPVNTLVELSRGVLKGDVDGVVLGRAMSEFFDYAPIFRSAEVTAGRTVEILKETPPMKSLTELMKAWDVESMAKMDTQGAWTSIAEDILSLADEPGKLKLNQVVSSTLPKDITWWGQIREGFLNTLLARPITWTRTFLGNTVAAAVEPMERELAGWLSIDAVKGVRRGEGFSYFKGEQLALGEAFSAFGDAFRKTAKDLPGADRFDIPFNQIGGPLGRIINVPGGVVRGLDRFFKAINRNGDTFALSIRKAREAGWEWGTEEFNSYVARRRLMPTTDMMKHSKTLSEALTFQQELGDWGKAGQRFLQYGPMALYFPFIRSGVNLVKWGWYRTPGIQMFSQALYHDILAGGERADMAIARLTLSNMFAQFYYGLAQEGVLTSGGPVSPSEKRSFLAAHNPYSIMGKYPIQNAFEPGSTPAELVADFAYIRNQLADPTAEQTANIIGFSIAKDVLNNTWWRQAADITDLTSTIAAGEEVGNKGSRILASPLIAIGTGGPLGQSIERQLDPVQRETRSWMDEITQGPIARLFGFHKEGIAKRDGYGDPLKIPQALGSEWLRQNTGIAGPPLAAVNNIGNPFLYKPQEEDRVKKEGARLHVSLPPYPWSIGSGKTRDDFDIDSLLPGEAVPVELQDKEYDRRWELYRNILRSKEVGIEKVLLDTPEYQNSTWAAQREMFHTYVTNARSDATKLLLLENRDLTKRLMEAKGGAMFPLVKPEERQQVEQKFNAQLNLSLDLMDNLNQKERDNLMRWGIIEEDPAKTTPPASTTYSPPQAPTEHPVEFKPEGATPTP